MRTRILLWSLAALLWSPIAQATCPSWHSLTNGSTADATQVMDNFNVILSCPNFTGSVGVGISTPATKFEVSGAEIFGANVGNKEFALDSSGANYGFLSNRGVGIWDLGYGPTLGSLGTAVLTWNSTGNVGIGTTGPVARFDVAGLSSTPSTSVQSGILRISDSSGVTTGLNVGLNPAFPYGTWFQGTNQPASLGGAYPLLFNPLGGTVGIGDMGAGAKLEVASAPASSFQNTGGIVVNHNTSSNSLYSTIGFSWANSIGTYTPYWGMAFQGNNFSSGLGDLAFFTRGSERVRITDPGYVGIGTTSPAVALHVVGTIRQTNCTTAGTLATNAQGDIICSSDVRLKNVIGDYDGGLDALAQITPKLFTYKPTASDPVETFVHAGFTAQNVVAAIPQASARQRDGYGWTCGAVGRCVGFQEHSSVLV